MHVKAIFNLNVTCERIVELDVIGESYLVRGSIINSLWLGFEQMKLCKPLRRDMQHSNQILQFYVFRALKSKLRSP